MRSRAGSRLLHSNIPVLPIPRACCETFRTNRVNSVGAQFILGSWYKKSELGIRAAVFCVFGHVGSMAGGWIQAGLLQTLAGKVGLPAWKWIFIIVSVMTVPVALFGKFIGIFRQGNVIIIIIIIIV